MKEWFEKNGYVRDETELLEIWSRDTIYGAPRDRTDGSKVKIHITADGDGTWLMTLTGFNGNYETIITLAGITESYLRTRGRELEMRLIGAWREFN